MCSIIAACGEDTSADEPQPSDVADVGEDLDVSSQDTAPDISSQDVSPDLADTPDVEEDVDDDVESFLDQSLRTILNDLEVPQVPISPTPPQDQTLVALGQALFFDPILSGNKDVACSTCHLPSLGTSDALLLSSGTTLANPDGQSNPRALVARHALDLFGRGNPEWETLFWDGRIERGADGEILTPLGDNTPDGLSGILAAQALFPFLDRSEMLGQPGDRASDGSVNELAAFGDDEPTAIFEAIVERLRNTPGYIPLFAQAFPERSPEMWTIQDVANALAAYQTDAFALEETPWDLYLQGDRDALSDVAKIGASVFFTTGGCGGCHSGALFTDQRVHVTGVAQLGPGLPGFEPFDPGRFAVTGREEDRFAFRTTPLRNVELTAPYMHNGSVATLERVLAHYARPNNAALREELPDLLPPELRDTIQNDPTHLEDLNARLSPLLPQDAGATVGLSNVREFLKSLTSESARTLGDIEPSSVPSGLPPSGRN